MSKVTSKLQVTIPKSVAKIHGIVPGSEIVFESAGDSIRVRQVREDTVAYGGESTETEFRLKLFEEATARQEKRRPVQLEHFGASEPRGWTRDDLYRRVDGSTG
ncbi:MAG: AbrB/MazE/SpoVT family DNA-binding domain-containing protein [Verrucomicrobiaceae bacterium]|nr:AbrB/MazE/SpoVT family DNA-binding domain-containing protein [Verrucomicrobiaceae bacterium]